MKFAPGPYQTQDVGSGTAFHCYVIDANGRKIGVAWGPVAEKVWTQALFAASHDMFEALKGVVRVADRKTVEFEAARAAIAKVEGEAALTSTQETKS